MFDKNKQPIVSNNVSVSVLDTGIKVTNTAKSQNLSAKYIVCDLTGFEGKQITVSSDILSSGNNEALLYLSQSDILGNEDDSTEVYTGNVTSGKLEVTITITDTLTDSNKYLLLRLYGTRATQAVIGSYITYSNLVVSQGPTAEYEEYVEKEIYVKNDNGVFERFYSEKTKENLEQGEIRFVNNNETFYCNWIKEGRTVTLQINSGSDQIEQYATTIIGTLPEKLKPVFELSFPVTKFGNIWGTGWITSSGEINYSKSTSERALTRVLITYIAQN